jgi:ribose 5-phosphate isomerase B
MKVYIGADHKGYNLKEGIKGWLRELEYDIEDVGALMLNPTDDYTTYASEVGTKVGLNKGTRGILFCGSGVGVDVVANKFNGVRASVGKVPEQIKAGRNDDDMNVLVIAADFTDVYSAKNMIKMFLETKFEGKERHKRRLAEITKIEETN